MLNLPYKILKRSLLVKFYLNASFRIAAFDSQLKAHVETKFYFQRMIQNLYDES